jgi:hypothetical protein
MWGRSQYKAYVYSKLYTITLVVLTLTKYYAPQTREHGPIKSSHQPTESEDNRKIIFRQWNRAKKPSRWWAAARGSGLWWRVFYRSWKRYWSSYPKKLSIKADELEQRKSYLSMGHCRRYDDTARWPLTQTLVIASFGRSNGTLPSHAVADSSCQSMVDELAGVDPNY